ncbi:enoyl-CoA hydratase/isomerase family protein [Nocardioides sp.]|uniref:enoyl-CoA hydratase/isomerase family protein n=1 Tax=Nocardioides sp. TaxID=35761 RepID=UPI003D0D80BD
MGRRGPAFEEYADRYRHIAMERDDGVLQVTLHTDGQSLAFGIAVHEELGYAFADIADDPHNQVVILTGTGDDFCSEFDTSGIESVTPRVFDDLMYHGRRLIDCYLAVDVPVIAAVNGPVRFHSELAVLADIVLASDTATFQDGSHFTNGVVPGDGHHPFWTHALGSNRGRYFLLTGQVLDARTAHDYGVVNEVVPRDQLVDRAWELAREVAAKPRLVRQYTRRLFTNELKRLSHQDLAMGFALEGLGQLDSWNAATLDGH